VQQVLDVLANDLGTGIQMSTYAFTNNNQQGNLRWNSDKNKFVYKLVPYR
jgi:hypothetical protein